MISKEKLVACETESQCVTAAWARRPLGDESIRPSLWVRWGVALTMDERVGLLKAISHGGLDGVTPIQNYGNVRGAALLRPQPTASSHRGGPICVSAEELRMMIGRTAERLTGSMSRACGHEGPLSPAEIGVWIGQTIPGFGQSESQRTVAEWQLGLTGWAIPTREREFYQHQIALSVASQFESIVYAIGHGGLRAAESVVAPTGAEHEWASRMLCHIAALKSGAGESTQSTTGLSNMIRSFKCFTAPALWDVAREHGLRGDDIMSGEWVDSVEALIETLPDVGSLPPSPYNTVRDILGVLKPLLVARRAWSSRAEKALDAWGVTQGELRCFWRREIDPSMTFLNQLNVSNHVLSLFTPTMLALQWWLDEMGSTIPRTAQVAVLRALVPSIRAEDSHLDAAVSIARRLSQIPEASIVFQQWLATDAASIDLPTRSWSLFREKLLPGLDDTLPLSILKTILRDPMKSVREEAIRRIGRGACSGRQPTHGKTAAALS